MSQVTWEKLAVKAVALGIPLILSILGFIALALFHWGIWVTSSIDAIRSDIRVIKVANHLSLEEPRFGVRKSAVMSFMQSPIDLLKPKNK